MYSIHIVFVCPHADLNHGPLVYKTSALPLSYRGVFLPTTTGFEPVRAKLNRLAGGPVNHSGKLSNSFSGDGIEPPTKGATILRSPTELPRVWETLYRYLLQV